MSSSPRSPLRCPGTRAYFWLNLCPVLSYACSQVLSQCTKAGAHDIDIHDCLCSSRNVSWDTGWPSCVQSRSRRDSRGEIKIGQHAPASPLRRSITQHLAEPSVLPLYVPRVPATLQAPQHLPPDTVSHQRWHLVNMAHHSCPTEVEPRWHTRIPREWNGLLERYQEKVGL